MMTKEAGVARGDNKPERLIQRNIGEYCWSCGYDPIGQIHLSAKETCYNMNPGHKFEENQQPTGWKDQSNRIQIVNMSIGNANNTQSAIERGGGYGLKFRKVR